MTIDKIFLKNFTVFDEMTIKFSPGINVFIGENGTGKTHILKLLYSACQGAQAKKKGIDFPQKIVNTFRPDDLNIGRLVHRGKAGNERSEVKVSAGFDSIEVSFDRRTKPVDDKVKMSRGWEREFENLASTFIPAKEILSNAHNLIQAITVGNVEFDDTYKDIIAAASVNISNEVDNATKKRYLESIQKITAGKVKIKDERFYLIQKGWSDLEFQLVAEGLRKFALLWQLIKNGTLEKGSILFWDEPEANINPRHIPAIVDLLLNLERDGVQIFIASHDYFFSKYLEARKTEKSKVAYHALHKAGNAVLHERADDFQALENNSIIDEIIKLYKEEVRRVMA